jgi:hypothetical protein
MHGSENHFQFTDLHFKAMGFIKFINQRKSHECCGRMMTWLLVEGQQLPCLLPVSALTPKRRSGPNWSTFAFP